MNRNAGALVDEVGIAATAFDRAAACLESAESSDGTDRLSSDQELLARIESASRVVRLAEAALVKLAGDVQRRSAFGDDSSLAKRMGATSAPALVAERAFLSRSAAVQLVKLGEQVRPREALSGEALPATRPHLAVALADGRLSVSLAGSMVRCLEKVAPKLTAAKLDELEQHLVASVDEGWSVDYLLAYLKRIPDMVDQDGAKPRDEALAKLARVLEIPLESGLTRFILDLDPVTAGLFKTAMDAGATLNRPGLLDGEADDPDTVSEADTAKEQTDHRPLRERRVDGVRLMAMRALKMDDGDVGGTAVTMLVTITEESLKTGVGSACIDGIEQSISASMARRLAVSAELIPVVLGGEAQPIDVGTGRRFFTRAQRRAMAARDGGCIGPACSMPVSACDGAHIRPAGYGATSVDNGALLCWHCHQLHDLHGWQIRRENGRWWWTPPPWIDPRGRRRPGGRIPPPAM